VSGAAVSWYGRRIGGAFLLSILLATTGTAFAQGFFDLLFRRPASPPQTQQQTAPARSYADPNADGRTAEPRRSNLQRQHHTGDGRYQTTSVSGPAYCVRLCDGRYFPISNRGGGSAELCKSFCPASPTRVFVGGNINQAVSSDGKRYSDMPNAFVYREKLVADCTCNGNSQVGLAPQRAENDPTLQPGDIVATQHGLMAYRGENRRAAELIPVNQAAGLSGAIRKQLSATRVQPAPARTVRSGGGAAAIVRPVDQRSQASR
jgi:hypothetical protein